MNISTPTAILISGILIALVIAFKDNSPKYHIAEVQKYDFVYTYRTNIETGEVCYKHEKMTKRTSSEWICE